MAYNKSDRSKENSKTMNNKQDFNRNTGLLSNYMSENFGKIISNENVDNDLDFEEAKSELEQ